MALACRLNLAIIQFSSPDSPDFQSSKANFLEHGSASISGTSACKPRPASSPGAPPGHPPNHHPGSHPSQHPGPHLYQYPGHPPNHHPGPYPNHHPGPHQHPGYSPDQRPGPHLIQFLGPHQNQNLGHPPNQHLGPHPNHHPGYQPPHDSGPPDYLNPAAQRPQPTPPPVQDQGRGPKLAPRPSHLAPDPSLQIGLKKPRTYLRQPNRGTHWYTEPSPIPTAPSPTQAARPAPTTPATASAQSQRPNPVVDLTTSSPCPIKYDRKETPTVVLPPPAAESPSAEARGTGQPFHQGPSPPAEEQATRTDTPAPVDSTQARNEEAQQQQSEDSEDSPRHSPQPFESTMTEETASPSSNDTPSPSSSASHLRSNSPAPYCRGSSAAAVLSTSRVVSATPDPAAPPSPGLHVKREVDTDGDVAMADVGRA
ncbi:hypothetical protein B0T18DRAFT_75768 [Schizothecium vesticola]|uniref:Uncharacterized protein n=1 Tax=Schizothecium vesticola TaxID=314040 RepID=A0AA40F5M7_9PEZI|nr:hypothetical protein B0T18DRAFT_75768 [Schizothecium vesticola]